MRNFTATEWHYIFIKDERKFLKFLKKSKNYYLEEAK